VARGAEGIANAKGFYRYTKGGARRWEKKWVDFTYDMRRLADRLGCGCPYYHTDSTFTKSGYWRALILTETEILKLLARLSPDG